MLNRCEHFRQCSSAGQNQTAREQRPGECEMPVEEVPVKRGELTSGHLDLAEHILRLLDLFAKPDLAVFHARRPVQIEHALDPLQRHRDPFEPVGQLRRHGRELDAAGLLEVGELRNFLAVEEHLPADAPRAERRRFPVVLFEPDVMLPRIDAACLEALEIQLLDIVGSGLEDDLKLMVLEQAVRVLAKASVRGTPRRLHVGHAPVRRSEDAEKGLGMHRARADFDVERLLKHTPARRPELRQFENQSLESHK